MKKHLYTKNSPAAIGPYSQAVAIDNLVFLSGQIPLNNKGKMVEGTVEQQTQQIFSNIEAILMEGGGTLNDLVKLTVFLTSLDDFEVINTSNEEVFAIISLGDITDTNAAVEAARAGEQGRGFAVVASEVRNLAQRSAEAAKDIKELISDSVSKIASGNQLVVKSGETMAEVVTSIKCVNDIMSEIAAASAEQASGIEEVSKAVIQMDEMTQQNAALVEEAAAAADSLKQQSLAQSCACT